MLSDSGKAQKRLEPPFISESCFCYPCMPARTARALTSKAAAAAFLLSIIMPTRANLSLTVRKRPHAAFQAATRMPHCYQFLFSNCCSWGTLSQPVWRQCISEALPKVLRVSLCTVSVVSYIFSQSQAARSARRTQAAALIPSNLIRNDALRILIQALTLQMQDMQQAAWICVPAHASAAPVAEQSAWQIACG